MIAVHKWTRALEAAGIQFIAEDATGGVGVRLRAGVKLATVGKKREKRLTNAIRTGGHIDPEQLSAFLSGGKGKR